MDYRHTEGSEVTASAQSKDIFFSSQSWNKGGIRAVERRARTTTTNNKMKVFVAVTALLSASVVQGYQQQSQPVQQSLELSRRSALRNAIKTASAVLLTGSMAVTGNPHRVLAADDVTEDVYFGVGCFWHIQVRGEKRVFINGGHEKSLQRGWLWIFFFFFPRHFGC